MKKTMRLALMMVLLVSHSWPAGNFLAELTGSYMAPNDPAFKEVYGQGGFVPELRLHFSLGPSIYLWGGAGMFSKKGLTPQMQNDAKSNQTFLSLGGGFMAKLGDKLNLRAGPGLFLVSYKEQSAGSEQSGTRLGFRADMELLYSLGAGFLAGLSAGYATASDTVEEVSFKMGGLRVGVVVGIRF